LAGFGLKIIGGEKGAAEKAEFYNAGEFRQVPLGTFERTVTVLHVVTCDGGPVSGECVAAIREKLCENCQETFFRFTEYSLLESGEFGREPEFLVLAAALLRFNTDGTEPDFLPPVPLTKRGV